MLSEWPTVTEHRKVVKVEFKSLVLYSKVGALLPSHKWLKCL